MNVSELLRIEQRNCYGELAIDFESAIFAAYPGVVIAYDTPGCWGHSGRAVLRQRDDGKWLLVVPSGKYSSGKHFHTAGCGIMAIESSRKKLNLAGCPLFLLSTYAYNGDYRSLKRCYWLFGKNEDDSFFLHQVRPKIGETGDLDLVRRWLWELKATESIAGRQGDLAFIKKAKPSGDRLTHRLAGGDCYSDSVQIGNHLVRGSEVYATKHRYYVLNPAATHHEHYTVALEGWHELRLAKVWSSSRGD